MTAIDHRLKMPRKQLITMLNAAHTDQEGVRRSLALAEIRHKEGMVEALENNSVLAEKIKQQENKLLDMTDLKIRLAAAELQCEYMRGYLARVRELDVVASPLVKTGNPQGEQIMRAKHPATEFPRPDHFTYPPRGGNMTSHLDSYGRGESSKPRHWVTFQP